MLLPNGRGIDFRREILDLLFLGIVHGNGPLSFKLKGRFHTIRDSAITVFNLEA
jgi:hypothetical protein